MIYIRWRTIANNVLHHLLLIAAVLVFLWAVFLSVCRLALPYLPRYQAIVADVLSTVMGAPVTFTSLHSHWTKMQPVLTLDNVNIWSQDKLRPLMQIPEVNVRLNLFSSLIHRQVEISLLQIKQWQLRIYQNSQGQWEIAGIQNLSSTENSDSHEVALEDFLTGMSQIHHLQLQKNSVMMSFKNHKQVSVSNINLDWYAKSKGISVYGSARLQGPTLVKVQFGAEADRPSNGNFIKDLKGHAYLKFSDVAPAPWLAQENITIIDDLHGNVSGEAWGTWQKSHWENITAKLHLDNFGGQKTLAKKLWIFDSHNTNAFINAQWSAQQRKIHVSMDSEQGRLTLGDIFRNPIPYEQISFQGDWLSGKQEKLSLPKINILTSDANVVAKLALGWSAQAEPHMDLVAHASFNTLKNKSEYLPAGVMPKGVVAWLDHAIVDGKSADAEMLWHGPLKHFPFHDQSGTMQIFGAIKGATLDYAVHWPLIKNLDANLFFTSHGMHIQALQGQIGDLPVSQVNVDIPEFKKESVLVVHGNVQGDLTQAWSFLNNSPLQDKLSALLEQTNASGPFGLALSFILPLYGDNIAQYHGLLNLQQDQLSLKNQPITFSKLFGNLSFDNQSVQSNNLSAQWMNEPWHFVLNRVTNSDAVRLQASGNVPVELWAKEQFKFAATWFHGYAYFTSEMLFDAQKNFSLTMKSNLQNLEVHLPMDFDKTADSITPMTFSIKKSASQPLMLEANLLTAKGKVKVISRENNWIITTPSLDGKISQPTNNAPYWQVFFNRMDLSSLKLDDNKANLISLDDIPAINILANHLTLPQITLQSLQLNLRPDKSENSVNINSLIIKEAPFTITAVGSWIKTTAGKTLTQLKGKLVSTQVSAALKALGLPSLLEASQASINFNLSWPGALWQFDRTHLNGQMNINMTDGVFTDVSEKTNAQIDFARLLNILSINALPARLSGNKTQKGFSFGQLSGTMNVAPQIIDKININIIGAVANVALNGCLNMSTERLNLFAEINPKLTESLPVIATLAGGPVVGAIGFVADKIFSPAVGKISGSYYAVTGNENNPQTTKVDSAQKTAILASCPI